jgi:hypothetical protein
MAGEEGAAVDVEWLAGDGLPVDPVLANVPGFGNGAEKGEELRLW